VKLRPLMVEDAEQCVKWMNSAKLRRVLRIWLPMNILQERAWIEAIAKQSKPPADIPLLIEVKGKAVGVVGLHNIQWDWRCAEIGICIGKKKSRHCGAGSASYRLLLQYAFDEMDLRLIESEVYTTNKPSMHFHKSLGFKRIGLSDKKALVDGKRVRIALYSMTRKRWRELNT